jgi:hypothetical protein
MLTCGTGNYKEHAEEKTPKSSITQTARGVARAECVSVAQKQSALAAPYWSNAAGMP